MDNIRYIRLALYLVPIFVVFHARAEDEFGDVRAGVVTDWPPYYTVTSEDRVSGFAIDVMDAIAQRTGLVIRYQRYPNFPAVLSALEAGEIDMIPNVGVLEERPFLFTSSYDAFGVSLFVRESDTDVQHARDLRNKTVGFVTANVGELLIRDIDDTVGRRFSDVRGALFGLLAGEVDALIYPAPVVRYLARSAGIEDQIREVRPALGEVKRAMAVRADAPELHARFEAALASFVHSPEYQAIFRKWHQEEASWWTVHRVLIAGFSLLAIVVVGLLMWRYITIRGLMRQLRFQANLLDVIEEAVIVADNDGNISYWNKFAEELYGWSREEVLGRSIIEIMPSDQNVEEAATILKALKKGESWAGEFPVTRRDGSTFPALVTSAPIFDDDGNVNGIVGVSSDLTRYKELEQQLRQAQKMEAIGRLAGGIAHDFNNLLTVLRGNMDLVLDRIDADGPLADDLNEVSDATDRATVLTRQLLAFSRNQTLNPETIDLPGVIDGFRKMLQRILREDIELTIDCGDNIWPVKIDRGQFEQVLMNLTVNAGDAMPDGGELNIVVRNITRDPALTGVSERNWVEVQVRDTGVGISPEIYDSLFDPFFTTKKTGEGTGLGLAMVHGIVTQSGGSIDLNSKPGEGATFRVMFPRSRDQMMPRESDTMSQNQAPETALILVVEDEQAVRELTTRLLSHHGYEVIGAANADEAFKHLESSHPDLLITDVVMPGMRGPEMVSEIHRRVPGLPVLYITGYAEQEWFPENDTRHVLLKPFNRLELIGKVQELLQVSNL